jgi:hypothetical protein
MLGVLFCTSCRSTGTVTAPTEILLRINNTDDTLQANMTGMRVTLSVQQGDSWHPRSPLRLSSKGLRWPVDIPITPSTSASVGNQLELVVDALAGEKVVAQTRAIASFVKNERRLLEVYLYACPGHTLDEGPVCAHAGCQAAACEVCSPAGICEPVVPSVTTVLTPMLARQVPQNKPPPSAEPRDAGRDSGPSRPLDSGGIGGGDASNRDAMSAKDGAMSAMDAGVDGGSDAASAIDPCTINHGGCDLLVKCSSSGSRVACDPCPSGYVDTNGNGTSCADIDECMQKTADCKLNATCQNLPGTYDCPCDVGFHGNGHQQCLANVLCDATGSNCGSLGSCTDVSGTKYCVCGSGYEGDGVTCTDIDECKINNGGCGNPTYFSCANNTGRAPTCGDVDQCKTDNGGCGDPTYVTCSNNRGMGPTCTDIHECLTNNGNCGDPANFSCVDNYGRAPTCGDVNECNAANICTSYYPCVNQTPYYACIGQFPDWTPTDSPSTFTVHGSGATATVTDSRNGLEWQRSPPSTYQGCAGAVGGQSQCTWPEAKAYCTNLILNGTGWRLPTQPELESIVDYAALINGASVAISPTAFAPLVSNYFWSSSRYTLSPDSDPIMWTVRFSTAVSEGHLESNAYGVRCVR